MDTKIPSVSIIVINFNGLHNLKNCMPSLLNQSYPKDLFEIIVVDNGSIDQSVKYLEKNYPEIKIIKNHKNEGFAKPNNQAARIANGEYLALINNDMVAKTDWLEQLVATMKRTGAECVAGTILNWNGTKIDFVDGGMSQFGQGFQIDYKAPIAKLNSYDDEEEIFFACGGAMLIKKAVYLTVGGLDEEFFAYFEDVDFGWRLWLLGYKVVRSLKAISYHRHHGTAKKFSRYKRVFHAELNALCMIYKNYDDSNYLKFLIGRLLLRFTRIAEELKIDFNSFSFDAPLIKKRKAFFEAIIHGIRLFLKMKRIMVQLAVMAKFVTQIPNLKEKRKTIQTNRVRSDDEIMKLIRCLYKNKDFKTETYINCFEQAFRYWDI